MSRVPSTRIEAHGVGPGRPARGYSWPPFEVGNLAALRSGIWSERTVDPVADELILGLLADRPELAGYPETLAAWGRAEARCLLLAEHYAEGVLDGEGKERPGIRYIAQFERLAADLRARLGLDPRSEAELARERADAVRGQVDLEALRERGRQVRLAAEQGAAR